MSNFFTKPWAFFTSVVLLTAMQCYLFALRFLSEDLGISFGISICAFGFLTLNISILAMQGLFAMALRPRPFRRMDLQSVLNLPTAFLYCIRNESYGLKERISYTLERNQFPGLHLWILSDSNGQSLAEEERLIQSLRQNFPDAKIFYRNRKEPAERKQGNIKDWLVEHGKSYKYFIVCDADSLLPSGWAIQLLAIAEHPENSGIAVFQSAIYIAHENSLYARMEAIAQYYAQKLYFTVNQKIFGRSIAFGHNCLIYREAFEQIDLPAGILSHDNWETALLEQKGYRTVFVPELISFEEATPHYLEARKRTRRWLKGTLQGWPLLFLPGITFSTRFLIFYQIYTYLVQPVLFGWIVAGLLWNEKWPWIAGDSNFPGKILFIFLLFVLLFHKFAVAKTVNDAKRIISEILFSTLIGLQNIFYGTLDFLTLPFHGLKWIPMAKDPGLRPDFTSCCQGLFGGTLAGLLLLILGLSDQPFRILFSAPFLASLILSIPMTYWSSQTAHKTQTACLSNGGQQGALYEAA